jgi:hypothetical protein
MNSGNLLIHFQISMKDYKIIELQYQYNLYVIRKTPINMYEFVYLSIMSKSIYSGLERNTCTFLDNLQQKAGPPIYTLSPYDARAVLS